jgi:hypothetical protein
MDFKWFFELPSQGQATLAAAFVAGLFGIMSSLVKDRFKVFAWLCLGGLIISLMGVAGWSSRFDFASHSNYAIMVARAIQLEDAKDQLFELSKKEIFFVGASMHITMQNRRDSLLAKLKEGVTCRFLIADPDGSTFSSNAKMFGQSVEELRRETVMTVEGFRELSKRWEAARDVVPDALRGQLILKMVDEVFPAGMYFFDAVTETKDLLVVPHSMGHDAPELPAYRIPSEHAKTIATYYKYSNEAWSRGTVVKQ